MSLKLFVSYSSRDLPLVNIAKAMLAGPEVEVYVAEHSLQPGADIAQTLTAKIKECDLFLLLWSANAASSEWVPQEIGIAKASGREIIPVVLHRGLTLPGFIAGLKYLDFGTNPTAAFGWLQQNIAQRADGKRAQEGLVWLGVGGVLLWLFSKGGK